MACDRLGDARGPSRFFHLSLHGRRREMIATGPSSGWIPRPFTRREQELPADVVSGSRILAMERARQLYPASPSFPVLCMLDTQTVHLAVGIRCDSRARGMPAKSSRPRTSRKKNASADVAWFRVLGASLRSFVNTLRNSSTCPRPSSSRRLPGFAAANRLSHPR